MKRALRLIFTGLAFAVAIVLSIVLPADLVKGAAPWVLTAIGLFVFASFQVRFENIEMDLDAVEEALDRIEPDYHHQVARFRYGRSRPDILNHRAER